RRAGIRVVGAARSGGWLIWLMAGQSLRQQTRGSWFTDPTCAGKKVRVMESLVLDGVAQSARDWLLPGDFVESLRAPLACDYLVAHDNCDEGRAMTDDVST